MLAHLMGTVVEKISPRQGLGERLPVLGHQCDPFCLACLNPAGMEAFVKVEECPEQRLLKMGTLSNEPEDMDYPEEDEETYHVIQVRSFAKDKPVTWTYYIAAEEMDWDYAPVKPVSLDR